MSKFVRKGADGKKTADSIFYLADHFSVLLYYRTLKEGKKIKSLPKLIPKYDFGAIPEEVADELDWLIDNILLEFERGKDTAAQNDALLSIMNGEVNLFGFILHDTKLKQAIGNVAVEVFYRDERITEEEAYKRAQETLPKLFDEFESFLNDVTEMTMRQVQRKAMSHGVSIFDMRKLMKPMISSIDFSGIHLEFEPITGEVERTSPTKQPKTDDTMYI